MLIPYRTIDFFLNYAFLQVPYRKVIWYYGQWQDTTIQSSIVLYRLSYDTIPYSMIPLIIILDKSYKIFHQIRYKYSTVPGTIPVTVIFLVQVLTSLYNKGSFSAFYYGTIRYPTVPLYLFFFAISTENNSAYFYTPSVQWKYVDIGFSFAFLSIWWFFIWNLNISK